MPPQSVGIRGRPPGGQPVLRTASATRPIEGLREARPHPRLAWIPGGKMRLDVEAAQRALADRLGSALGVDAELDDAVVDDHTGDAAHDDQADCRGGSASGGVDAGAGGAGDPFAVVIITSGLPSLFVSSGAQSRFAERNKSPVACPMEPSCDP